MIRIFRHKQTVLSHDEACELVRRFFNGETSLSEEQAIYHYFADGDVHPLLKQYGEMFGWYATGMQPMLKKQRSWRWVKVVAAALIAGVVCTFGVKVLLKPVDKQNELAEMYAGSYIIKNGKKITNINKVLPQVIEQEKYADQLIALCTQESDAMFDDIDAISMEEVINSIPDPDIRKQLAY